MGAAPWGGASFGEPGDAAGAGVAVAGDAGDVAGAAASAVVGEGAIGAGAFRPEGSAEGAATTAGEEGAGAAARGGGAATLVAGDSGASLCRAEPLSRTSAQTPIVTSATAIKAPITRAPSGFFGTTGTLDATPLRIRG